METKDSGAHTPAEDEAEQLARNAHERNKDGEVVAMKHGAETKSEPDKLARAAKAAD